LIAIKPENDDTRTGERNVLGGALGSCSTDPMTGFYRNGCCSTGPEDSGSHTVCAVMTSGFLEFSRSRGNDLMTPKPEWGFPGLKEGDRWCLCAVRWLEAFEHGCAPRVVLSATHERALDVIDRAALEAHLEKTDDPFRRLVNELDMQLDDGEVAMFRAKVKVSFKYEGDD